MIIKAWLHERHVCHINQMLISHEKQMNLYIIQHCCLYRRHNGKKVSYPSLEKSCVVFWRCMKKNIVRSMDTLKLIKKTRWKTFIGVWLNLILYCGTSIWPCQHLLNFCCCVTYCFRLVAQVCLKKNNSLVPLFMMDSPFWLLIHVVGVCTMQQITVRVQFWLREALPQPSAHSLLVSHSIMAPPLSMRQ